MENAIVANKEVLYLPVDRIKTNPYQPRKFFNQDKLMELARSIQEFGVMQPVSVRLINGVSYELVAGERRLRASKLAGLATVPAIVVHINDQDSAFLALIENLQRQNLNYLEEAEGYMNLMEDYAFTQEELADRIGKSQSTIANKMRILRLSKQVQKMLLENDLSERHARALLRLPDEKSQIEVIRKIITGGLTVKATEDIIEKMLAQPAQRKNKALNGVLRPYVKDIRLFTNTVKQAVDIMQQSGVQADYTLEEGNDSYEIHIKINYPSTTPETLTS